MRKLAAVAALLLVVSLSACAGAQTAAEPTVTPSPTPEFATENQVASVVAQFEADWREVIDNSGECRAAWVFDPGSIQGATCWLTEQTLTTTAEIAIRDLGELSIPPSMEEIVASTTALLQGIVDLNAKTVCGEGADGPANTPECTEVLGGLNFYYTMLDGELGSWRPYL